MKRKDEGYVNDYYGFSISCKGITDRDKPTSEKAEALKIGVLKSVGLRSRPRYRRSFL